MPQEQSPPAIKFLQPPDMLDGLQAEELALPDGESELESYDGDPLAEFYRSSTIANFTEQYKDDTQRVANGEQSYGTVISIEEMRYVLQSGRYTVGQLDEFASAMFEQRALLIEHSKANKAGDDSAADGYYNAFTNNYNIELGILSDVHSEKLEDLYISSVYGSSLRSMLERNLELGSPSAVQSIYHRIYTCDSNLELLNYRRFEEDPILIKLLSDSIMIDELTVGLRDEMRGLKDANEADDDLDELELVAQIRLGQMLDLYLGSLYQDDSLRKELRLDIESNIWQHAHNWETGELRGDKLVDVLSKTAKIASRLGVEKVMRLRNEAGIVNLDYRSADQYELLLKVLDADKQTIEHLQAGDVTVVFNDEMGDYNGAYHDIADKFATKNKRTLVFGMLEPGDMYRAMLHLKKIGIAPSTIVVGAHGDPGVMEFQKGVRKFAFSHDFYAGLDPNSLPAGEYFLHQAKGFARLVDEFMQDSRGIDDNPDAIGRRRVILSSCSQAAPADAVRYVSTKRKDDTPGKPRAVHLKPKSTAQVLSKLIDVPQLDLYATRVPIATDMSKDGKGIEAFSKGPEGEYTEPEPFVKHFINARGDVVAVEVKQLILRREGANEEDEWYE